MPWLVVLGLALGVAGWLGRGLVTSGPGMVSAEEAASDETADDSGWGDLFAALEEETSDSGTQDGAASSDTEGSTDSSSGGGWGDLFGSSDSSSSDGGWGDLFKALTESTESGDSTAADGEAVVEKEPTVWDLDPELNYAKPEGVGDEFTRVAKSDTLELFFNLENSEMLVYDKRNGHIWRSNPDLTGLNMELPYLWQQHMKSTYIFAYTDSERSRTRTRNMAYDAEEIKFEPIDNGVRATYVMSRYNITLAMEFTLNGDSLDVRIPNELLKEEGDYKLVTLELLPFFGGQPPSAEGYAFYPDGSGAISYFKEIHPEYTDKYQEFVYGPDLDDSYFRPAKISERAHLPVFGIKAGDAAFVGIITDGDHEAKVNFAPAGHIVEVNRVAPEFIYRKQYTTNLRRGVVVDTIGSERIPGDRAVRYVFLSGQTANYAGMATAYRQYLMEEKGLQKASSLAGEMPFNLKIFMGIEKPTLLVTKMVQMTTYDQAIAMLEELKKLGIDRVEVTLLGWNAGGYYGSYPRRLPADGRLGGVAGLERLMAYAAANNVTVYLHDNYVDAFQDNGGFAPRRDAIRKPNRLPFEAPWSATPLFRERLGQWYILNARFARERYAQNDIPKIAAYGVNGIAFDKFGEALFSDHSEGRELTREQFAEEWRSIMQVAKDQNLRVAVEGGNAFTLDKADKIIDMPLEDSGFYYGDEAVPFFQIALHGLVPYTSDPGNLRYDPRRQYLKQVEVGALPVFELTHAPSDELKDTEYNRLFSPEFSKWKEVAAHEYREMNERLGHTWTLLIVDHQKLRENVYQTTYEDGTRVIVNYNAQPVTVNGVEVKGMDYTVVKPQ